MMLFEYELFIEEIEHAKRHYLPAFEMAYLALVSLEANLISEMSKLYQ